MSVAGTTSSEKDQQERLWFRYAVQTDVGQRRQENQDNYGYLLNREASLFIVADGMGGARGGATASAMAVEIIARNAVDESSEISEASLRSAIELSNALIFERSREREDLSGMGTTVVALAVVGRRALIAHVGDSRIYRLQNGGIEQLTRDHTLVQELVDSGTIAPEQAENHPIAHMLTRSLGPTGAVDVESRELSGELASGEKFLLCCDGLYNLVTDEEIRDIINEKPVSEAVEALVTLANERGGTDNITVELIEFCPEHELSSEERFQGETEYFISADVKSTTREGEKIEDASEAEEIPSEPKVDVEVGVEDAAEPDIDGTVFGQAYDSIIFGENPTADEIREHEERIAKGPEITETAEFSYNDIPEGLEGFGEGAEDEDEEEVSDEQFGELQRFQLVALAVVLVALAGVVYSVMPQSQTAVEPESQQASVSVPATESGQAVSPATTTGEVGLQAERDRLAKQLGLWDSTGEPEALEPVAEEPTEAEAVQPTEEQAVWPEARIIPEGVKLLSETVEEETVEEQVEEPPADDVEDTNAEPVDPAIVQQVVAEPAKAVLTTNQMTETVPQSEVTPEPVEVGQGFEEIIASVSDLSVGPVPGGATGTSETPNQPIIWEHEESYKKKIEDRAAAATAEKVAAATAGATPIIFSEDERGKIIVRKIDLREKIANIDAKLQSYAVESEDAASLKLAEIEQRLALVDDAIEYVNANVSSANRRYVVWMERKAALGAEDPKQLADEIAAYDEELQRTRDAFQLSSLRYLDAVELWRANPQNDKLVARMSELGRELEGLRVQLDAVVRQAVERGAKQARFDLSEFSVIGSDLERRRDRLQRHLGVFQAHSVVDGKTKAELQRSLLDERRAAVEELKRLRGQVPDEAEREVRRSTILRGSRLN